jgi:hypothetical protein
LKRTLIIIITIVKTLFYCRKECFCGDEYGIYGNASDKLCNIPCIGNASQLCGGEWKNFIYLISYQPKIIEISNDLWKWIAAVSVILLLLSCSVSYYLIVKYHKIKKLYDRMNV